MLRQASNSVQCTPDCSQSGLKIFKCVQHKCELPKRTCMQHQLDMDMGLRVKPCSNEHLLRVHCATVSDTNRVLLSEAAILRTVQSVF